MKKVKQNTKTAIVGTLLASALVIVMFVGFNSQKASSQNENAIEANLLADNMSSAASFEGKCGDDKTKEEKASKDAKAPKEEKSSKDAKATKDVKSGDAKEEGKCGEGKCGDDKAKSGDAKEEGKCGEGKCGDDKAKDAKSDEKSGESKCGEGKCGK